MDMTKTLASVGAVLVGLWLILSGLGEAFGLSFSGYAVLRGLLGIVAGLVVIAAGALAFQDR
jgi:hypothetical protein